MINDLAAFLATLAMGAFAWFSFKLAAEEAYLDIEDPNKHRIFAYVEKHGDSYYIYNFDSNTFIVQFKTLAEFTNHVDNHFPGKTFIIKGEMPTE